MKLQGLNFQKKQKCFLAALFIICTIGVSAQKSEIVFGKISQSDMNYKECAFDTESEAVVFYDGGNTRFINTDDGFNVVFSRFTRIKILKENGTKWAQVEIPLYVSNNVYETVNNLEAIAYNYEENGTLRKTPLNTNDVKIEKINEHWMLKKFAIPDVKPGTIIDYKYEIYSEYVFNLRDWQFQWKIPVLYSEYNVGMIPFYEYTYSLQGASRFDEYSSVEDNYDRNFGSVKYRDLKHHFGMKNLPAFRDEEFISSINDYVTKLDFQLSKIHYPNGGTKEIITTWPAMKEDLIKDSNFGKYEMKFMKMADKLINVSSLMSKPGIERMDSVLNFVKSNFKWDNTYGVHTDKTPAKLLSDKAGSSAELNLMTCGLLNAVKVTARPVIISTRNHGKINRDYPFYDSFNNVVLCVQPDSNIYVTDATIPDLNNKRLPLTNINGFGLIIDNLKKIQWIGMKATMPSLEQININLDISPEQVKARVNVNADEYFNHKYRTEIGDNKTLLLKRLSEKNHEITDSSVIISNYDNKLNYCYSYHSSIKTERMNDKLYISPFMNEIFSINPLKQKSRSYPVDLVFSQRRIYNSEFRIPGGYTVTYKPVKRELDNDNVALKFTITQDGDILKTTLDYYFKKPEYSPNEYSMLKDFFKEIILKASDKIVLEKK